MHTKLIAIALICVYSLPACAQIGGKMTLESQATVNLSVVSGHIGPVFGITISGMCGHSAYAVEAIEVKKEGRVLNVLVWLIPAKQNLTGSFSKWVPIPDDITSVVFGKEKKVIWPRQ